MLYEIIIFQCHFKDTLEFETTYFSYLRLHIVQIFCIFQCTEATQATTASPKWSHVFVLFVPGTISSHWHHILQRWLWTLPLQRQRQEVVLGLLWSRRWEVTICYL